MKSKAIILSVVIASAVTAAFITVENHTLRTVKKVHKPTYTEIEGLSTYRVMPSNSISMEELDPFLFLNHHGPQEFPPNNDGLPFEPHPHKGFETVTFILDGDILHRDNNGHESVITGGGIQWMTAGRGIVHSELSSEKFKKTGGNIEILQLWVNLPSRLKNTKPDYTGLQEKEIPHIKEDNGKVTVNLISGKWKEAKAPIQSLTGVVMSSMEMKKDGYLEVAVDESRRIFFYVVKGVVNVNGTQASKHSLVEFEQNGSKLKIEAGEDAVILFGHAQPTNEPIVSKGPFVMNTQQEIQEAYRDYQQGKFDANLIDE